MSPGRPLFYRRDRKSGGRWRCGSQPREPGNLRVARIVSARRRLPVDVRQIVVNGLTIRGSVEGHSQPRTMIPRLVDLYEKGMFPIDKLIVEFPLAQINLALKAARAKDIVKPVIVF